MIYFIAEKRLVGAKVKIGYTSRDVNTRLKELQTSSPNDLKVVCTISDNNYYGVTEESLHQTFSKYKTNREWFKYSSEIKEYVKFLNNDGFFMSAKPVDFTILTGATVKGKLVNVIGHIDKYRIIVEDIKRGDRFLMISHNRYEHAISFPNLSEAKQVAKHMLNNFECKFHGHKNGPIVIEITGVL